MSARAAISVILAFLLTGCRYDDKRQRQIQNLNSDAQITSATLLDVLLDTHIYHLKDNGIESVFHKYPWLKPLPSNAVNAAVFFRPDTGKIKELAMALSYPFPGEGDSLLSANIDVCENSENKIFEAAVFEKLGLKLETSRDFRGYNMFFHSSHPASPCIYLSLSRPDPIGESEEPEERE